MRPTSFTRLLHGLRSLTRHLLPIRDRDVLLVTDGHVAYRNFARQARTCGAPCTFNTSLPTTSACDARGCQ